MVNFETPRAPSFFSFPGTSLLAVTPIFGEADMIASEENFSLKLAVNTSSAISAFDAGTHFS